MSPLGLAWITQNLHELNLSAAITLVWTLKKLAVLQPLQTRLCEKSNDLVIKIVLGELVTDRLLGRRVKRPFTRVTAILLLTEYRNAATSVRVHRYRVPLLPGRFWWLFTFFDGIESPPLLLLQYPTPNGACARAVFFEPSREAVDVLSVSASTAW